MINIQFMTEDQAYINKRGEKRYKPDIDRMLERASCEEERQMLLDYKKRTEEHPDFFDGFVFAIVYTDFYKSSWFENGKQVWGNRWQIMQHPWYTFNNKRLTKLEMIKDIATCYMDYEEFKERDPR